MYKTDTIYKGSAFTIQDVVQDDIYIVSTFLEGLDSSAQKKCLALLERIGNHGPPKNIEKFRHEGNGIYAIKTREARILCFFSGDSLIVLTHGFKKHGKGGKMAQVREREKAEGIRVALGLN